MPSTGKHARTLSDTLCEVSFSAAVTGLLSVALALVGCGAPPAEFRVVGWEEARRSVEKERLTVVEALADARVATPPTVPDGGGVLVFGLDAKAARASAATFARAGNRPVLVFIPRDADERGRFSAVASQKQEVNRGKDS